MAMRCDSPNAMQTIHTLGNRLARIDMQAYDQVMGVWTETSEDDWNDTDREIAQSHLIENLREAIKKVSNQPMPIILGWRH